MIDIEMFKEIRKSKHLIIFDTNVLLELYRMPANISIDVINVLEKAKNQIYIPHRVYEEYLKHRQKIRGDAKKKYENVTKELSEMTRELQDDISKKIAEYRKHNYTDVTKLQKDLFEKIEEIQDVIHDYKDKHATEIQLNINFLEKDEVNKFVERLKQQGCLGEDISFTRKLEILREGELRYNNLIPPGFRDNEKVGEDRFGDLFIWKDMISVAREQDSNILFVCNDTKEDWWKKEKGRPEDLRKELNKEFAESNPELHIHFLTLDRFFSYIAEEFEMAKSKSALQLTAMQDITGILDDHEEKIETAIQEYVATYSWEEELNEDDWNAENEKVSWKIAEVSVEKEEKKIIYYVNIDISVLADLEYCGERDDIFRDDKLAWALTGDVVIEMEEYSSSSEIKEINIESGDIMHVRQDTWDIIGKTDDQISCKEIIRLCKEESADPDDLVRTRLEYINRLKSSESMRRLGDHAALSLGDQNSLIWGDEKIRQLMSKSMESFITFDPEETRRMKEITWKQLSQLGTIVNRALKSDSEQEE